MSAALKLAAFAAALAAIFGVATFAGAAVDPDRGDPPVAAHAGAAAEDEEGGAMGDRVGAADSDAHGDEVGASGGGHGAESGGGHGAATAVRGLAAAQDGLRLVLDTPALRRGARERVAFRIVGTDGAPLRDYDVTHERKLHLIVVRRDLSGFQHLHPTLAADGTWSTALTLPEAGSYRLFADFSRDGEPITLASDLRVDGDADLRDLPAPVTETTSDGGDAVTLAANDEPADAGVEQILRFAITRDGAPAELEPYLGADGHLVALREGDLAFLHVHPSGDGPAFETTFPTPGRYRLFLQYKVAGRVETAAFTQEVTG
ncbi:hypothetical protein [Conexibacter sp. CPCC 206217]|uniref:hypothetical protein n=1 Tax=Conexibacter sp. CPCC 206217 TaxID=3064574 RepID=UPI00271DF6D2|nr:hypothetical protein [Conexibacter sp. CPCC 206217]MDO8210831.1 hypothetical protein [Conexibacter sp. CPCC 206217]